LAARFAPPATQTPGEPNAVGPPPANDDGLTTS